MTQKNRQTRVPTPQRKFHPNRLERDELLHIRWRIIDVAESLGEEHPFYPRLYELSLKVSEMFAAYNRVGRGMACDDKEMRAVLLEDFE